MFFVKLLKHLLYPYVDLFSYILILMKWKLILILGGGKLAVFVHLFELNFMLRALLVLNSPLASHY